MDENEERLRWHKDVTRLSELGLGRFRDVSDVLEMCQVFFTATCLAPGSAGLRERGGVGTTWVHHSPDNNLPGPLLHKALCWFTVGHQGEILALSQSLLT